MDAYSAPWLLTHWPWVHILISIQHCSYTDALVLKHQAIGIHSADSYSQY